MFLRFLIFSGTAALVNLMTGQLLYGVFGLSEGWEYSGSVSIAFLTGMGVSYILNRRYTFPPSGRAMRDELAAFFVVSLGGLALTTGLAQGLFAGALPALDFFSARLPIPMNSETLAHMIAIGVTAFYSFFAHRGISFRRARAVFQA